MNWISFLNMIRWRSFRFMYRCFPWLISRHPDPPKICETFRTPPLIVLRHMHAVFRGQTNQPVVSIQLLDVAGHVVDLGDHVEVVGVVGEGHRAVEHVYRCPVEVQRLSSANGFNV